MKFTGIYNIELNVAAFYIPSLLFIIESSVLKEESVQL